MKWGLHANPCLSGLQEPPARVRRRPIFDQIFEPLLGEVGTIKFVAEEVHRIGGNINKAIDRIHDTDHGVRICNKEAGSGSHGVCFTAGKCRCGTVYTGWLQK